MNRILQTQPLGVARTISSFCFKSLRSISEEIQNEPLSVRAHVASMLGDFFTGCLMESGYIEDAEQSEDVLRAIESRIFDTVCPELSDASQKIKQMLSSEGGDMLRGYKIPELSELQKEVA